MGGGKIKNKEHLSLAEGEVEAELGNIKNTVTSMTKSRTEKLKTVV